MNGLWYADNLPMNWTSADLSTVVQYAMMSEPIMFGTRWDLHCARSLPEGNVLAVKVFNSTFNALTSSQSSKQKARQRRLAIKHEASMLAAVRGGMLDALQFLHSKGIIHRQVMPEHILCNDTDHFVLADFGKAGDATTPSDRSTLFHHFMAPEMYTAKRDTPAVDIWSLGIVCAAMTFQIPPKREPFVAENWTKFWRAACQIGRASEFPEIQPMLQEHPAQRPSAKKLGAFVKNKEKYRLREPAPPSTNESETSKQQKEEAKSAPTATQREAMPSTSSTVKASRHEEKEIVERSPSRSTRPVVSSKSRSPIRSKNMGGALKSAAESTSKEPGNPADSAGPIERKVEEKAKISGALTKPEAREVKGKQIDQAKEPDKTARPSAVPPAPEKAGETEPQQGPAKKLSLEEPAKTTRPSTPAMTPAPKKADERGPEEAKRRISSSTEERTLEEPARIIRPSTATPPPTAQPGMEKRTRYEKQKAKKGRRKERLKDPTDQSSTNQRAVADTTPTIRTLLTTPASQATPTSQAPRNSLVDQAKQRPSYSGAAATQSRIDGVVRGKFSQAQAFRPPQASEFPSVDRPQRATTAGQAPRASQNIKAEQGQSSSRAASAPSHVKAAPGRPSQAQATRPPQASEFPPLDRPVQASTTPQGTEQVRQGSPYEGQEDAPLRVRTTPDARSTQKRSTTDKGAVTTTDHGASTESPPRLSSLSPRTQDRIAVRPPAPLPSLLSSRRGSNRSPPTTNTGQRLANSFRLSGDAAPFVRGPKG